MKFCLIEFPDLKPEEEQTLLPNGTVPIDGDLEIEETSEGVTDTLEFFTITQYPASNQTSRVTDKGAMLTDTTEYILKDQANDEDNDYTDYSGELTLEERGQSRLPLVAAYLVFAVFVLVFLTTLGTIAYADYTIRSINRVASI